MIENIAIPVENYTIPSAFLKRPVSVDFFLPNNTLRDDTSLLLINDGQDMETLGLTAILSGLYKTDSIKDVFCVGIHCGEDRKNEYGTAGIPDFKGRGAKAGLYTNFIFQELLPFIYKQTGITAFKEKSFAGFSLGGLSAIDIVWNHPQEFANVGVFSGSLWWRTKALDEGYVEETDRIIHTQIKRGKYSPRLKFFFETGTQDETADRNNNGIIDSIDDTLGLITELELKGYISGRDIMYLELPDGKHDVPTWAKAMPDFLKWCWGKSGS